MTAKNRCSSSPGFPRRTIRTRNCRRTSEDAATLYDDKDPENAGYFREITLLDQQVGRLRDCLRRLEDREGHARLLLQRQRRIGRAIIGRPRDEGQHLRGRAAGARHPRMAGPFPARNDRHAGLHLRSLSDPVAIAGAKVEHQPRARRHRPVQVCSAGRQTSVRRWDSGTATPTASPPGATRSSGIDGGAAGGQADPVSGALAQERPAVPVVRRRMPCADTPPGTTGHGNCTGSRRVKRSPSFELYNLADDPMERNDRAEAQPERVAAMSAALEHWQRSVLDSWAGKDYSPRTHQQ